MQLGNAPRGFAEQMSLLHLLPLVKADALDMQLRKTRRMSVFARRQCTLSDLMSLPQESVEVTTSLTCCFEQ